MRWLKSSVVVAVLLAMVLAVSGVSMAKQVTLNLVTIMPSPTRDQLMKSMLDQFEKENPDIKVNLISLPWEQAYQKLLTMYSAGEGPDVTEMAEKWVSQFAAMQVLADLRPNLKTWKEWSDFTDAARQMSEIANKTPYIIPWGFYERALYYRADWFKEAGINPPQTFEDFVAAAEKLTDKSKGRFGYALRGGAGSWDNIQLWMLGYLGDGNYFDSQGRSNLNKPGAVKGLEKLVSIYKKGLASPDSVTWGFNDIVGAFYSGHAAMLDQDPDTLSAVRDHMDKGTYAVAPLPVGPSGKTFFQLGFPGWSMSKKTAHPKEAWKLLSFLASPENSAKFAQDTGAIPVVKSAQKSDYYNDPIYKAWFTELNGKQYVKIIPPWYLPEWGTFFNQLVPSDFQKVLLGQQSAQEAADHWAKFLTDAEQKYRKSVKK
ncbi:MAG: ABC transporter substrate-binding protein [Syntrophothermus sp.]